MAAAAAAVALPLQWTDERWRLLVLAAAATVLEAREKRLPFKGQLAVPVLIQDELGPLLLTAERARKDMADHAAFLDGIRDRLAGSADAPAVLEAAFVSGQLTEVPGVSSSARCAITQSPVDVASFVLFGHRGAARFEHRCMLGPDGKRLIQACMTVGGVREWLDAEVTIALGPSTRTLHTNAELDALMAQLAMQIRSFQLAVQHIYICCCGPIPRTAEETRQAAFPVWEAQTDFRELIRSAHTVLWADCKWKHYPLTTPEELRHAYKALSKRIHPDKVSHERREEATRLFRVLHERYEAVK